MFNKINIQKFMITIICALSQNGAIGFENKLLYYLKRDLQRFKYLTTGNTIIMGRRTFESLPKGALPNRKNIVLTKNKNWSAPKVLVYNSLQDAIKSCDEKENIFIIGGASVYKEALKYADALCLSFIEDTPENADAFFPNINYNEWKKIAYSYHESDEHNEKSHIFIYYKKKKTLKNN